MDPINWHSFFFLLFALLACAFAVAVVVTSNIVRMAFYLVMSLAATSGLFFVAGADFVAAMQLMIYVGGTLVLLIFGVMLTAQGPFINMKTRGGDWILAALVSGALLAVLVPAAFSVGGWRNDNPAADIVDQQQEPLATSAPLGLGLLGVRVDKLDATTANLNTGRSGYLLPFEIVSIHLLVVLVGAAYLARSKRRRNATSG
ncbi:MAG: NADH-quinone oxidoreductase subunit J [Planctomycetes bacterium]|nr:NADH-quinone oxidoreductase subunit J [Planctomycetota bacterium]